jgi:glutamate dehydrogenase (NAD(P)+)
LLKSYYGTGGDLNIDEVLEVVPITEQHGLWHPQEGVVNGHFQPTESERIQKLGQLRVGVAKVVEDPRYTPNAQRKYVVADLITGWGVAESVRHNYALSGSDLAGKRVVVQGWGNVGSSAAYYLAKCGARIVAIIDREGGLINEAGFGFQEVQRLFEEKQGNRLHADALLSTSEMQRRVWSLGAQVFLPCAASRLVSREQIDSLVAGGLEVVGCGANVPFADAEIFYGPTYEHTDQSVAVIPDFIANCGMARAFAYLMGNESEISDEAIFGDVSQTILDALTRCHQKKGQRGIASTAFEIALAQLLHEKDPV